MEPVYSLALCKNVTIIMRLKSGVYHLQVIYLQLSENSDSFFFLLTSRPHPPKTSVNASSSLLGCPPVTVEVKVPS